MKLDVKYLTDPIIANEIVTINGIKCEKGSIVLVGGYTGSGKTHFLMKMLKKSKGRKLFFSLELSESTLFYRYVYKHFSPDDLKEYSDRIGFVFGKGMKLEDLIKMMKLYDNKGDKQLDMIFIDSPETIRDTSERDAIYKPDWWHEEKMFKQIDSVCEDTGIILVTTRQIRGEGKEYPSSAYFKGSSIAKERADVIVILKDDRRFKLEKSRVGQSLPEWIDWTDSNLLDDEYLKENDKDEKKPYYVDDDISDDNEMF